jgi:hypothetical protein
VAVAAHLEDVGVCLLDVACDLDEHRLPPLLALALHVAAAAAALLRNDGGRSHAVTGLEVHVGSAAPVVGLRSDTRAQCKCGRSIIEWRAWMPCAVHRLRTVSHEGNVHVSEAYGSVP